MFAPSLPRFLLLSGLGLLFLGLGNNAKPADPDMEELLKGLESPIKVKRLQAMKGLGMKGTAAKEAVAPLIDHMRRHKDQDLANQAAQALAQIGSPAVGELIKALEDPSAAVQIRALSALGILGPEARQGIVPVSRFLENKDAKIRALAAWVLGEIGPPARPAADTLAKALRDADPEVRRRAAEALHEIGSDMVAQLLPVLKEDDLKIRLSAVQALAIFHERKEAGQALVDALRDPKMKVRTTAADTLVSLGTEAKAALPSLLIALKEPELELQSKAFTAIMAIGSYADDHLLEGLDTINREQRWTGPYVLKQFGPKPSDAVRPLLRLLQDADATNRLGATLALAKLAPTAKAANGGLKIAQTDLNLAVCAAALARTKETDKIGKSISRIVGNLKDAEELDPDKIIQLYILLSTLSSSRFFGDQPDGKLTNQLQQTTKWASEAVDKLPALAVPALVRGINVSAQLRLAFTEPFSRLTFKLRTLIQDSDDIPSLTYSWINLGKGIPQDSPFWLSIQATRFQVLKDSNLLNALISAKQARIQMILVAKKRIEEKILAAGKQQILENNLAAMNFIEIPFQYIYFFPVCVRDRFTGKEYWIPDFSNPQKGWGQKKFGPTPEPIQNIYNKISTEKNNLEREIQKTLLKERRELQFLLLLRTQTKLSRTQKYLRLVWNSVPLIVENLKDPDPMIRWVAIQIISRKRIPAEKELIKLLSDPKVEVREAAHHALIRLSRTIDLGRRPQLWTAWLESQEPSTYRPSSSEEPGGPLDLDLHLGEKKKIRPKKSPGEKSDPKNRDQKDDDREKKSDLKNAIPKKEPGEQRGRDKQAPLPSLPQPLWREAWLFEFAPRCPVGDVAVQGREILEE